MSSVSRSKQLSALEKLKARRKEGKSAIKDYEANDLEQVYDEVDEASYQMIVRRRLNDDFVVDDDGLGYADYGVDDWNEDRPDYSDYESDEGAGGEGRKRKSQKKEKVDSKRKKGGPVQQDISAMLMRQQKLASKKGAAVVVGPSTVLPVAAGTFSTSAKAETAAEDELSSLLEEVDNETVRLANLANARKKKRSKFDVALHGSLTEVKARPAVPIQSQPSMFNVPVSDIPETSSYADLQELQVQQPIVSAAEEVAVSESIAEIEEHFTNDTEEPVEPELPKVKVLQKEKKVGATVIKPVMPVIPKPSLQQQQPVIASRIAPQNTGADSWFNRRAELMATPSSTFKPESTATSTPSSGTNHAMALGDNQFFEENGSLLMFWIDAFEGKDGVVYLFGKVWNRKDKTFVSCCVSVSGIERSLYFLPRPNVLDAQGNETDEEVDMQLLWEELDQITSKNKISNWSVKECNKKYAFEVSNVPVEADWVEMNYGYNMPGLPSNLSGKTFSHVFGSSTPALESLILRADLMGPCWIEIKQASFSKMAVSWCRTEVETSFVTNDPDRLGSGDLHNIKVLKDSDLHSGLYPDFVKSSPPLTVMSLSLKTVMNYRRNVNEIVMASALVYRKVQADGATSDADKKDVQVFSVIRQLDNNMYPLGFTEMAQKQNLKTERTEVALLNFLMAIIHLNDPDILVGHNFVGFDLDVLLHRMKELKINFWSRIGRLRRTTFPRLQAGVGGMGETTYGERQIASGRLLCDTYLAAKDTVKAKSYSLTNLTDQLLKVQRPEVGFEEIPKYYADANDLLWLSQHCENDAYLSMSLVFHMMFIPLTKQLTNLAGNLWTRTMSGARAERNEFLLLHEFSKNGYIVPDKSFPNKLHSAGGDSKSQGKKKAGKDSKAQPPKTAANEPVDEEDEDDAEDVRKTGRRKPAYSGGLVLEPKKGLYDKFVLMLDFNSLYPSIIQEYNICFTTVERNAEDDEIPSVPDQNLEQGILPRLLATLVQRRRQVKSLMKEVNSASNEYAQLNIRQQALKLTANSMYGCLGFSHSRFYAKPLAMLITSKGREILQDTVNLAEQTLDLNVIYGDTDSIMVYTNSDNLAEVKSMGQKLKAAVNKKYKLLEIEMDGFFKRMLLLKKKKYAALTVSEGANGVINIVRETKGLDLVRRDWCDLSRDICNFVLDKILSDAESELVLNDIHEYLSKVGQDIRTGDVPLEKFVINKALTKAPEEYNDAKSQPHVQVAMRMKAKGLSVRVGDTVPFIICQDEDSQKPFAQRAYHPDDVKKAENNLKIDNDYYLNVQIHPPVARLCRPIEGTDDSRLAQCLGLDASKFKVVSVETYEVDGIAPLESQISDSERFKQCERVKFVCCGCGAENTFETVKKTGDGWKSGFNCVECGKVAEWNLIGNHLLKDIRFHIRHYYNYWMICDDPGCGNRTRQTSVLNHLCNRKDDRGDHCRGLMHQEYSDSMLYTQLMYYSSLFDIKRYLIKQETNPEKLTLESICHIHAESFHHLHTLVRSYLDNCSRGFVDFNRIFSLTSGNKKKADKSVNESFLIAAN